jgi:hypothetical protein
MLFILRLMIKRGKVLFKRESNSDSFEFFYIGLHNGWLRKISIRLKLTQVLKPKF